MPQARIQQPTPEGIPVRIRDAMLAEQGPVAGTSARQADLRLLSLASDDFLDTTHFDTVRFPPPESALQDFSAAAVDGSQAYSGYRGHPMVLEHVANVTSEFLGVPIDARKHVMLTPGTQAGLFAALAARVESNSRVAVFDPDYLFTARILRFLNCDVGYVPLQSSAGGFGPDLNALEDEFKNGTRHLVFSHPNNPTGAVYDPETIKQIAQLVRTYNVQVIVDELYSRLVYDDTPFTHLVAEPGMQEHVVTLLGPSKTESLSGYRIGVVIGPEETMQAAENVLSLTALRAPAYAQHVLLSWLESDQLWLDARSKEFNRLRQMTIDTFSQLPWLKIEKRQATAYAWIDVSALQLSDSIIAETLLTKANVLISPGYQFGPSGRGHFRVCYARDERAWKTAMDKMVETLKQLALKSL